MMKKVNTKIRLASISDVEALTDLHCESFKPEDHVPLLLGRNYVKATYKWLVVSPKSYVLVAVLEDEIIGFTAVCDGAYVKAMFVACLPEFILSILSHPKRILNKLLWHRLFRKPVIEKKSDTQVNKRSFAQLTIVAVAKEFRGTGVFGELSQAVKEYSKHRGSKAICVGVYKKNQSSLRAFTKSDWVEMPDMETPDTVLLVANLDLIISRKFGVTNEKTNPYICYFRNNEK